MNTQQLLTLTRELISMKTISTDVRANQLALASIKHTLVQENLYCQDIHDAGHPSLLVSNHPIRKSVDLMLHGHIDIVPGKDATHYNSSIHEGKLYGRGAMDMKGGLAVLIEIMKSLAKEKHAPSVLLLITSDEELGGMHGTAHILKQGYRSKFFITAEGVPQKGTVYTKAKGVLSTKLTAQGKSVHAARPWEGVNAIEKLYEGYLAIRQALKTQNEDIHWHDTVSMTRIHAGDSINSVPHYAEAILNIRFIEDWKSPDELIATIESTLKNQKDVELEIQVKNPMFYTNPENIYIQRLAKILKTDTNTIHFGNHHATNDARFATEIGIPAIEFGPYGGGNHTDNEWVDIEGLSAYYAVIWRFMKDF